MTDKRPISTFLCLAFIISGCVMMAIGILRGEVGTVFTKAVNICLECIGIG